MNPSFDYLAGVDGGGTKTLVRVWHADGRLLGQHSGPGAALRNGAGRAWAAILSTLHGLFEAQQVKLPPLDRLALGIGIAGYNVSHWAAEFRAQAPAFAALQIASDASTTLLGAHQGQPGAIIAVGTGTIALAMAADGSERVVDGWGFPSGDDASGAWMGLRAIHHVQHVVDGRSQSGPLAEAVIAFCALDQTTPAASGTGTASAAREQVLDWLRQADQASFARLARLVVEHADTDPAARAILVAAGAEIALIAATLDPAGTLPLALCGGLASALRSYLPAELQQRISAPQADAATGALLLIQRTLAHASSFSRPTE